MLTLKHFRRLSVMGRWKDFGWLLEKKNLRLNNDDNVGTFTCTNEITEFMYT